MGHQQINQNSLKQKTHEMRVDDGFRDQRHLDDDSMNIGIVVQPVNLTKQFNLGRAPS